VRQINCRYISNTLFFRRFWVPVPADKDTHPAPSSNELPGDKGPHFLEDSPSGDNLPREERDHTKVEKHVQPAGRRETHLLLLHEGHHGRRQREENRNTSAREQVWGSEKLAGSDPGVDASFNSKRDTKAEKD